MSSSKFYWINKDSINWKSFDSSEWKSFFLKRSFPIPVVMGDIKEPHREGRRGAWWDAGADKTDQDPLTITKGAFLFRVCYYTLI